MLQNFTKCLKKHNRVKYFGMTTFRQGLHGTNCPAWGQSLYEVGEMISARQTFHRGMAGLLT